MAKPAEPPGVGPDLTSDVTLPANRTACPQCGASVRLGADFCGQCYADFRPPTPQPSAPLVPAPTAAYGVPAADPLAAPVLEVPVQAAPEPVARSRHGVPEVQAKWPCTRCDAQNEMDSVVCTVCGQLFLQTVSEETRVAIVLPVVGDLGRMSRGQRAGVAFGILAIVLVPLALITMLLTGKPPAPKDTPSGTSSSTSTGGATTPTVTTDNGSGSNE